MTAKTTKTTDRKIPAKRAALQQVASHLGACLHGMDAAEFYSMFGFTYFVDEDQNTEIITPKPTPAEIDRMEWALGEARRRLSAMGAGHDHDHPAPDGRQARPGRRRPRPGRRPGLG